MIDFSYWFPKNPCKMGIVVPSSNKTLTGLSSREYFQRMFGTFPDDANDPYETDDALPLYTRHISAADPRWYGVPWFADNDFDYIGGWNNNNHLAAMYIPTIVKFDKRTNANECAVFKNRMAIYPNKLVQLGVEPENWNEDGGGSNTPVDRYVATLDDLLLSVPELQYIGPNINLNQQGYNWLNSFAQYIVVNPARKPKVWGAHILTTYGIDHWLNIYYGFKSWLAYYGWENDEIHITQTCYPSNTTLTNQNTVLDAIEHIITNDGRCHGVSWYANYDADSQWNSALQGADMTGEDLNATITATAVGTAWNSIFLAAKYVEPLNTAEGLPLDTYGF